MLIKVIIGIRNLREKHNHLGHNISKIGKNTQENLGDQRRLTVIQT